MGTEHALQALGHSFVLGDPPAEGDRAAKDKNAPLARDHRADGAAAQSPFIDANRDRFEYGGRIRDVLVTEQRVAAGRLQLAFISPHLDVVILHRAVFNPEDELPGSRDDED